MNKKTLIGAFVIFTLVLTALITVPSAEAKQNTTANTTVGTVAFPGNSLYGRMHNKHFMYKWGNQNFESFEGLLKYLRENAFLWKKGYLPTQTGSSTLINVITQNATNIEDDSATLNAKIELDEGETAEVWFTYGTTTKLTSTTSKTALDDEDDELFSEDIADLEENTRYYYRAVAKDEDNKLDYGKILYFTTDDNGDVENAPIVVTRVPAEITDDSATLRGRVEMGDFDNGIVFFVYGTNETNINDVDDDFDTYEDIDESGDDLIKVQVEDHLDGNASFEYEVEDLDGDTKYFYRVGVEYENEDGDDTLTLGDKQTFTTE